MLKSAHKAAKTAIFYIISLALVAGASIASEQPKYDKRIEAAAWEIVAGKIDDIRGSVEADIWVAEHGVDEMMTGPVSAQNASLQPHGQMAGLTPFVHTVAVPISDRPVRKISSFLYF